MPGAIHIDVARRNDVDMAPRIVAATRRESASTCYARSDRHARNVDEARACSAIIGGRSKAASSSMADMAIEAKLAAA